MQESDWDQQAKEKKNKKKGPPRRGNFAVKDDDNDSPANVLDALNEPEIPNAQRSFDWQDNDTSFPNAQPNGGQAKDKELSRDGSGSDSSQDEDADKKPKQEAGGATQNNDKSKKEQRNGNNGGLMTGMQASSTSFDNVPDLSYSQANHVEVDKQQKIQQTSFWGADEPQKEKKPEPDNPKGSRRGNRNAQKEEDDQPPQRGNRRGNRNTQKEEDDEPPQRGNRRGNRNPDEDDSQTDNRRGNRQVAPDNFDGFKKKPNNYGDNFTERGRGGRRRSRGGGFGGGGGRGDGRAENYESRGGYNGNGGFERRGGFQSSKKEEYNISRRTDQYSIDYNKREPYTPNQRRWQGSEFHGSSASSYQNQHIANNSRNNRFEEKPEPLDPNLSFIEAPSSNAYKRSYSDVEEVRKRPEFEEVKVRTYVERPVAKINLEQNTNTPQPRGQKCWPEVSMWLMEKRLALGYRQVAEHVGDVLIIPYRNTKLEVYPGNIVNKFKVDYRKKIEQRSSTIKNMGHVYMQKCVNFSNFKALGFMYIGESGRPDIKKCVEGIFGALKLINQGFATVLLPYSSALGPFNQVLERLTEQMVKYDFVKEVMVTTNKGKDFQQCSSAFMEKIHLLIDQNNFCIEF